MNRKFNTFAETEDLLLTAIGLPGNSIRTISAATGIKPNTLYKWKSSTAHLSSSKADSLLLYFQEKEPERLARAYDAQRLSQSK